MSTLQHQDNTTSNFGNLSFILLQQGPRSIPKRPSAARVSWENKGIIYDTQVKTEVAYDRLHGNSPYGKVAIRTFQFTSRLKYLNIFS